MDPPIPFNRPHTTGRELELIADAIAGGHFSGDGGYTRRASTLIETLTSTPRALLTTSCTHALELCALLLDLQPGDEVIMPSFTFVSTANAFALRGARPGLRRHPAGHVEHRRDADRGGRHTAHPSHRRRPLRRRGL